MSRNDKQPFSDNGTDNCIGKRVATFFDTDLFFGSVVERVKGAVLAE
jgi:hypothetical protein